MSSPNLPGSRSPEWKPLSCHTTPQLIGVERLDLHDTDAEVWDHRHSLIAKGDAGRMTVFTAPLPDMDPELRTLLAADHR